MMTRQNCERFIIKKMAVIFIGAAIFFLVKFFCLYSCYMKECNCDSNRKLPLLDSFSEWNTKEKPSSVLTIVILTSPKNLKRRNAMRQTWLKTKLDNALYFFVIGTESLSVDLNDSLTQEQFHYHDLLLLPAVFDSYRNLSKKVLETFIWISQNTDSKFLFKVDDDTFARLDIIVNELQKHKPQNHLYWGFFDGRARVKKKGSWAENDWSLCDYYLPHALGGGYILSSDLVDFIAVNSKYLKLYMSEDISVGTWLSPLDITRLHDPRFDTEYKSRGCFNSYIVVHKQSIEQMLEKHTELQMHNRLCRQEVRYRLSYIYNWNAPPTRCCDRNNSTIP